MSLDSRLQNHLERLLLVGNEAGGRGNRLVSDARRLSQRVERLMALRLISPDADRKCMELACYALQLPLRQGKGICCGKMGQVSLRERAEQAAELTISSLSDHADEELLDHTARLLRELPHRTPAMPEARLLADAVNLDDFGIIGLILQAMHLARQQQGLDLVADGFRKRQEYGYWDARLKDGFHFEPVRQIARQRLQSARQVVDLLLAELREDQQT